jgi:hypothetical protein
VSAEALEVLQLLLLLLLRCCCCLLDGHSRLSWSPSAVIA